VRRCPARVVVSIRHVSYLRLVSSVARLGHSDYDDALAFVSEAAATSGSQPFELPVIEGLLRLIPARGAGYYEYSGGGYRTGAGNTYFVDTPGCWPRIDWQSGVVDDQVSTWPLIDCRISRSALPLKLSDFLTGAELRRNPWYVEVMRPLDHEFELKVWLPAPRDTTRGFFFLRGPDERDFDERDRAVLALLRRHLSSIRERWENRFRPGLLTVREAEVLALVAEGLTNMEIAVRFVISPTTVRTHLENIFEKLGVRTRTAAAAWLYDSRTTAR
jgi:DNA-binding CsgD family transcriptional regulator